MGTTIPPLTPGGISRSSASSSPETTSPGGTAGDALRATVVMDVSSYAHALGGNGKERSPVTTAGVVRVLGELGFAPTRLLVALSMVPVTTGPESDLDGARRVVAVDRAWLTAEREKHAVPMVPLRGAHDGNREIGVDDLVVAATLIEAARIAGDPNRAGEAVVVMTHDGDMDHLARMAAPVPVVLVGRFDQSACRRMLAARAPHVRLDERQLAMCGSVPPDWVPVKAPAPLPVFPEIEASPWPTRPVMAVVDAYGLACSAASVLGLARLPDIESLRTCLTTHGVHEEPALLVTVPDISIATTGNGTDAQARVRAWADRDQELDALAKQIDDDGDDTTLQRRAQIHTARIPGALARRLDRSGPLRAAKRLATQLSADMVTALLRNDTGQVIVMTDSPHVAWLQSRLHELFDSHDVMARVTRWGISAAPVVTHSREAAALPAGAFLVLTEERLAQLVRLDGRTGRSVRQRLVDLTETAPGNPGLTWQVVGYDAEVDGVRLSDVDDPDCEVVIADALHLDLQLGQLDDLTGHGIELRFEPSAPSAMPLAAVTPATHGRAPRAYNEAMVIDRDGSLVSFDLDGDGASDATVDLGHDLRPVNPEASAVLGQLRRTKGAPNAWVYVAVTDDTQSPQPSIVAVMELGPSEPVVALPDEAGDARRGRLFAPPHSPPVPLQVGDRLWAIDTAPEGHEAEWVALSTALPPGHPSIRGMDAGPTISR